MAFTGNENESGGETESGSDDSDDDVEELSKKSKDIDCDGASDDFNTMEKEENLAEADFDKEVDIAKKVLKNLITSSAKGTLPSCDDDSALPKKITEVDKDGSGDVPNELSYESTKASNVSKPEISDKGKASTLKQTDEKEELHRTIFLSNLPFDVDKDEVKERFSTFGAVQSFVPVLHQVTKYVIFNLLCFLLVSIYRSLT